MNNKGSNEKKKNIFFICMILVLMFSITGATYAWFALSASNNSTVAGTAGTADLSLGVTRITPSSNNGALVPQLESALDEAVSSSYNCVDGNSNVVCHIYKIEIKNIGTTNVKVKGVINFTNPSMPNLKYKLMDNATTLSDQTSKYAYPDMERPLVNDVGLSVNETKTYYMVVWIDEVEDLQTDSGTYRATVKFESSELDGLTSTYVNYLLNPIQLMELGVFSEDEYMNIAMMIKTVSIVNYIDTINAVNSWDAGSLQNGGIIVWLEENDSNFGYYDMYIGSNEVIRGLDMQLFFAFMTNVDSIDFSNLDTSEVTDMSYMFVETGGLSEAFTLNLGDNFDTSSVTNMMGMFACFDCTNPAFTLDLGDEFDTSNVTNMMAMFSGTGDTSTVFTLDLGDKFDTSNVTNMSYMFSSTGYKSPVFTLDLGNKFDTSNVTDMSYMFSDIGNYNDNLELDLNSFDFSSVTTYEFMFSSFKTTQKIYVKDASDQAWILNKGFSNITSSNVLIKS